MKVFLSWSGGRSHEVAKVFHRWLPKVLQAVKPWLSSEDISKGTTWIDDIYGSIKESNGLGLFFLSRKALTSPWLMFEAGAIAGLGVKRVCVVLVDIQKHEVISPLTQFQVTLLTKGDIAKLLDDLNSLLPAPVPSDNWGRVFEWAWAEMESEIKLAQAIAEPAGIAQAPAPQATAVDVAMASLLSAVARIEARLGNVEQGLAANIGATREQGLQALIAANKVNSRIDFGGGRDLGSVGIWDQGRNIAEPSPAAMGISAGLSDLVSVAAPSSGLGLSAALTRKKNK